MSQLAQAVERAVREMKEQAAAKRKKALPAAQVAIKQEAQRRKAVVRNARRPRMDEQGPGSGGETAEPTTGTAQETQNEGATDMANGMTAATTGRAAPAAVVVAGKRRMGGRARSRAKRPTKATKKARLKKSKTDGAGRATLVYAVVKAYDHIKAGTAAHKIITAIEARGSATKNDLAKDLGSKFPDPTLRFNLWTLSSKKILSAK